MTDIYTPAINTFIEQIKGDKSLDPKWRNKAIARQEESLAYIRMAQTTTRQTPPEGDRIPSSAESLLPVMCTCIVHDGVITGKKQSCPVHGWA